VSGLVCRTAGDRGLLIEFGQGIDPQVNARVRAMAAAMKQDLPKGIEEIIPTYRSLLMVYNPEQILPDDLMAHVRDLDQQMDPDLESQGRLVEIPVCYGGEFGPDIANVCEASGLSEQAVIKAHSAPDYLIYMVGFTPGFPFLGGLDPRLATPRLKTPRMKVPKGSVGIANNQTGMYPIDSPGGWQIIGKTPLTLFAPEREAPFLYRAGDRIKFVPVSKEAFNRLAAEEDNS